jgi:hypothetical protein
MVALVMLAIMAGCAVFLYLKGTLVQGIAMILNMVIAGFIAFAFFEMLTRLLIRYSPGIAVWAPLICFLFLLILTFALLQTLAMQLGKEQADLGTLPEQVGRIASGILLGYLTTGYLLVAAAMAPLPSQYPYPRFAQRNPDPVNPKKALLSPDGFVTGLFATVSRGSFGAIRNRRSFAVLHAGYLDQLYLNRRKSAKDIPMMTGAPTIEAPRKNEVWYAPDSLRDAEGKPLSAPPGASLMLVRVRFRARALRDAGKFTLSQLRLVGVPKSGDGNPLAGEGKAVYPIGYVGNSKRLEQKPLDEVITMESSGGQGDSPSMDLAFFVPTDMTPLLLQFKRNDVVQLPAPASDEDAPEVIAFGATAPPEVTPPPANQSRRPPASNERDNRRPLSDFSQSIVGNPLEDE